MPLDLNFSATFVGDADGPGGNPALEPGGALYILSSLTSTIAEHCRTLWRMLSAPSQAIQGHLGRASNLCLWYSAQ